MTAFGATPDDAKDDTAAIQAAIDSLRSGQWLVFPKGRYLIDKSIKLRVAGVTLYGAGATIHATNPEDQGILISASGTRLYLFTKTAVTTSRKTAPWHAGIAIYGERGAPVSDVVVQGNRIVNAGAPGTPEANSASSAGIIVVRGRRFLIAGNTVRRSLADGIHVTSASRDGRVVGNTVEEVGDDMVAVVSYAAGGNAALGSASRIADNFTERRDASLNQNILIVDNNLSGQYWGRGITVAGAEGVTIRRNRVYNNPHAAGILLSREGSYQTFGVRNVLVDSNTIEQIQTLRPTYSVGTKATAKTTGHGAIEIYGSLFSDEADDSVLKSAFTVRDILLTNNKVSDVGAPGVRIGVQLSGSSSTVNPTTGLTVTRQREPGVLCNIGIEKTAMSRIHSSAPFYVVQAGVQGGVWCSGNTRDGAAINSAACTLSARPVVKGASLTCSDDGLTQ